MKKLILTLAAVAALVACSKDEIIEAQAPKAIAFADIFVENSTRVAYDGSYTKDRLKEFEVYATVTNSAEKLANIFAQERVWKSSNVDTGWAYDAANIQYWIAGNTYDFTAIVDGNVEGVTTVETGAYTMPTAIVVEDASKQTDVLYHKLDPIAYNGGDVNAVAFQFNHLLSKAKFSAKNEVATDNGYSYKVKDVKITNADKSATYTIGTGWGAADATKGTYTLGFGHIVDSSVDKQGEPITAEAVDIVYGKTYESNFERLLLPTNVAAGAETHVAVQFVCETYKSGVLIKSETKSLSTDCRLEAGHAYNFVVKLGNPGEAIKFTVEAVNEWIENHEDYNQDLR